MFSIAMCYVNCMNAPVASEFVFHCSARWYCMAELSRPLIFDSIFECFCSHAKITCRSPMQDNFEDAQIQRTGADGAAGRNLRLPSIGCINSHDRRRPAIRRVTRMRCSLQQARYRRTRRKAEKLPRHRSRRYQSLGIPVSVATPANRSNLRSPAFPCPARMPDLGSRYRS